MIKSQAFRHVPEVGQASPPDLFIAFPTDLLPLSKPLKVIPLNFTYTLENIDMYKHASLTPN